jgi:hypothetical protein
VQTRTIDQLRAGMVLVADVRAPNGRLLVQAGTALRPKHLTVMRTWGVSEAAVDLGGRVPEPPPPPSPLPAEPAAAVEADLASSFRHTDPHDPVIRELFRLAVLHRAGRLSEEDDGRT